MTQIMVNLDEGAATQTIRRAIGLLRGVASTTIIRTKTDDGRKTIAQQQYVKKTLAKAIDEVREAKRTGKKLQSADDFLRELEEEEPCRPQQ